MIRIDIPGRAPLEFSHLVLDYNGTIAVDGQLLEGLPERIRALSRSVEVHVLTADTYGTVRRQCDGLGIQVETFPREGAALCKLEIVNRLQGGTVCVGNGFNDVPMFDAATLSVAVLEGEGTFAGLLSHADVLVRSAADALDLFLCPDRLRATLRS